MYRVLIVEDDVEHASFLQRMLERYHRGDELEVFCISDPADLDAHLSIGSCDVALMDISFGAGNPNGIELVEKHFPLGCGTQVIYVTGHVEYCTPVYRTEHAYFLTKPVNQTDLDDALDKALANLESFEEGGVMIRSGGSVVALQARNISYVESDRRKVRIHAPGCKAVETYATLASMKEQLPQTFVHCHQSFLVNMGHVSEFRKNTIRLRSGEVIPVSQKKRKATHDALVAYLRGRL